MISFDLNSVDLLSSESDLTETHWRNADLIPKGLLCIIYTRRGFVQLLLHSSAKQLRGNQPANTPALGLYKG